MTIGLPLGSFAAVCAIAGATASSSTANTNVRKLEIINPPSIYRDNSRLHRCWPAVCSEQANPRKQPRHLLIAAFAIDAGRTALGWGVPVKIGDLGTVD